MEESKRRRSSLAFSAILCIYLLAVADGIGQVFSFANAQIDVLVWAALSVFGTMWIQEDCRSRQISFYHSAGLICLLTFPWSAAAYLIATRQWRGMGWVVVNVIAFNLLMIAVFFATYYSIYFLGWWQLYDPVFYNQQGLTIFH